MWKVKFRDSIYVFVFSSAARNWWTPRLGDVNIVPVVFLRTRLFVDVGCSLTGSYDVRERPYGTIYQESKHVCSLVVPSPLASFLPIITCCLYHNLDIMTYNLGLRNRTCLLDFLICNNSSKPYILVLFTLVGSYFWCSYKFKRFCFQFKCFYLPLLIPFGILLASFLLQFHQLTLLSDMKCIVA